MIVHPIVALTLMCDAVELAHARIKAAMADELAARRAFWIGGVPTELDLRAARNAVARRLKTSPDIVAAVLATPNPTPEE